MSGNSGSTELSYCDFRQEDVGPPWWCGCAMGAGQRGRSLPCPEWRRQYQTQQRNTLAGSASLDCGSLLPPCASSPLRHATLAPMLVPHQTSVAYCALHECVASIAVGGQRLRVEMNPTMSRLSCCGLRLAAEPRRLVVTDGTRGGRQQNAAQAPVIDWRDR